MHEDVEIIRFGESSKMISMAETPSLKATAIAIATQAKALSPVDTGQLRNSIGYILNNRESGLFEKGEKQISSKPDKGNAHVGSASDHAIFQEFGTVKQVAQPFLRPAGLIVGKDPVTAKKIVQAYQNAAAKEFGK
jgi:HK97 gp10 family phage protein